MNTSDILIIGAGAAGLMAARELSRKGKKVTVLEASDRMGGRIRTITSPAFDTSVEMGAEFIHGDLPVTLGLLHEHYILYHKVKGELIHVNEGNMDREDDFIEKDHSELLQRRLDALEEDMTVEDFLDTYFINSRYKALRDSVQSFVEGYDAADISRASIFAFREEWQSMENEQYRINGGYRKLIDAMAGDAIKAGCIILLSSPVKEVKWTPGQVSVQTANGTRFSAAKVLITVSPAVLAEAVEKNCSISFRPALEHKKTAAEALGYGSIIKVVLQFHSPFWKKGSLGKQMKELSFLFSDAFIPTWWTQFPEPSAILTGWLGGSAVSRLGEISNEDILEKAVVSLAYIFKLDAVEIGKQLKAWEVVDWSKDPYTLGAYSYTTVDAEHYRKILGEPVNNTLFFAGEAIYEGPARGTVEAALQSGLTAVCQIMQNS